MTKKRNNKFYYWLLLLLSITLITGTVTTSQDVLAKTSSSKQTKVNKHSKYYQLNFEQQDELGRAKDAQITFSQTDLPSKNHKKTDIEYNPVGWHDYDFYFGNGEKRAQLMERGQLIPDQFSDNINDKLNRVPMTTWLSKGNFDSEDTSNKSSVIYYVTKLKDWLKENPNKWLDYHVTALYTDKELVPRQIRLSYRGLDKDKQPIKISLNSEKEKFQDGWTQVTLDNKSDNANIDYLTGNATNTVKSAKEQEEDRKAAEKAAKEAAEKAEKERKEAERQVAEKAAQEAAAKAEQERKEAERKAAEKAEQERQAAEKAAQEAAAKAEQERQAAEQQAAAAAAQQTQAQNDQASQRIVYVTGGGKSNVYWYGTSNMPWNTNMNNIITMTEEQAISLGKRHSLKE